MHFTLRTGEKALFSDTQLFDDFTITLDIPFHHVMEQAFALSNHSKEGSFAGIVFGVGLKVLGQLIDPECHQGNL